jgi:SAM-dependent methyltransferase
MNPTIQDKRQPLPSLLTVYGPIEEFWESSLPAVGLGPEPSEALCPLDAFLIHRLLELVPGRPLLIDTALARTGGASSLIGLAHPQVRRVWVVTEPGSLGSKQALSALRGYMRDRDCGRTPLEVVARPELPSRLADQPGVMILTDARVGDVASLAKEIGHWLDEQPDALVLVLGLGRVGDCPAIASLLSLCAPESGKRLWLLRELSEVLMASHLGLVARHDHSHVADVLLRLQQFYTGNYCYLDLLRQVNLAALREARIDEEVLRSHLTFGPISAEIEELKRSVREAREQHAAMPWGSLARVLRKLAPMPVGKAWRLAKRVRRELAPTPAGRAYRLAKRVARTFLGWGRDRAVGLRLTGVTGGKGATRGQPARAAELPLQGGLESRPDAGGQGLSASQAGRPHVSGLRSLTLPSPEGPDSGGREETIGGASLSRLELLLPLLACPACRAALRLKGHSLRCDGCQARFPLHAGRPVLLPGDTPPRVVPIEHLSNQPPSEIHDWMTWFDGWILNIGAGETRVKLENVVEMEYSIFQHTDVAADAHHLPFTDASFDAVVSFNTFEHLYDPDRAAAEIFRILKPGGRLVVHTAVPQPLHEPPHHYYNVTEYGLRRWFRAFEIAGVSVSENFHPAHVIAWLASDLLRAVEAAHGVEDRNRLAASSLDFWRSSWEDAAGREHPLWDLLRRLPQDDQMRYAAGFQLDARKPAAAQSTAA